MGRKRIWATWRSWLFRDFCCSCQSLYQQSIICHYRAQKTLFTSTWCGDRFSQLPPRRRGLYWATRDVSQREFRSSLASSKESLWPQIVCSTVVWFIHRRDARYLAWANGAAFARNPAIEILRQRLQLYGIPHKSYSGHSFRKGAAQHASDKR